MSDAELLAAVQAITVTTTDSQLYTYAGVIDKLGIQAGFGFRATVRGLADLSNPAQLPTDAFEAINFAHERFAGGGIDLSRPDVQMMLDSFVAITPLAPFIPAVKAIGVLVTNPHDDATLQTLAVAKLEITKQAMEDAAVNRLQAYREALSSWDGTGEEPVL
jgi:hypothetical protein